MARTAWNKGIHLPGPMTGKKHSPETLQKMRLAKLGNKIRVGMKHTPESIVLMSENTTIVLEKIQITLLFFARNATG